MVTGNFAKMLKVLQIFFQDCNKDDLFYSRQMKHLVKYKKAQNTMTMIEKSNPFFHVQFFI